MPPSSRAGQGVEMQQEEHMEVKCKRCGQVVLIEPTGRNRSNYSYPGFYEHCHHVRARVEAGETVNMDTPSCPDLDAAMLSGSWAQP